MARTYRRDDPYLKRLPKRRDEEDVRGIFNSKKARKMERDLIRRALEEDDEDDE